MKKLLAFLLITFVCLSFSPVADAEEDQPGHIWAGGDFYLGLISLDLNQLNHIIDDWGLPQLDNRIFMSGGGGIGGEKLGHRFGGFGAGGRVKAKDTDMQTILDIGYGAFVYEYGVFDQGGLNIALGGKLGGGAVELTVSAGDPGNFEDIWDKDDFNSLNMTQGFLVLEPHVSIFYQMTDNLGISLNAGYLLTYTFGNDWSIGDQKVSDGPLKNFHTPQIGLGITLGF